MAEPTTIQPFYLINYIITNQQLIFLQDVQEL